MGPHASLEADRDRAIAAAPRAVVVLQASRPV
jgi:hypothetical protein